MLVWLFERKVFSPIISDPSTIFINKKKNYFFYIKKKKKIIIILKVIPVEKLAMQNFIFNASIRYKFTYTTFLIAEDEQI